MNVPKQLSEWYNRHKEDQLIIGLLDTGKSKKGRVGGIILFAIIMLAIFGPILYPYSPFDINQYDMLSPPSLEHLAGTDQFGRDLLSRILWGARVSLYVGFLTVIIAALIGITLGLISGFYRSKVDEFIMRMTDIMLSFPLIFLALMIIAWLGPSTENLIIALGVFYIPQFTRLTRASVLSASERDYVQAARAVGDKSIIIMIREILPNCLAPIIVQSTVAFSYAILAEATLSFLGLGIQPPTPAWGIMIADGRPYIEYAPWLAIIPGVAIMLTVLSFNLFGDALRDALDPRLRID